MKTRVWITVDSEPSAKFENGCWDYCVNGVWPRDLAEWCERGIAERTARGYRLIKGMKDGLADLYCDVRAPDRVLNKSAVQARIAHAESGLPLIFSVLQEFGVKATCFLDVTQLYFYGERLFREACDLIELSGNDLQLHLHPEMLRDTWYSERSIPEPEVSVEQRSLDELIPLFRTAASDFNRFAAKPAIAYRAGAYRISPQVIDALRTIGIRLDTSYDLLNKNEHVKLDAGEMRGNFPLRYRGVLEAPITAYRYRPNDRIVRFVPSRNAYDRIGALRALHRAGVPLVTYIFHSYGLMNVYGEGDNPKTGRRGPDKTIIANLRRELDFLRHSADFEILPGAASVLEHEEELVSATGDATELVIG